MQSLESEQVYNDDFFTWDEVVFSVVVLNQGQKYVLNEVLVLLYL